MNLADAEGKSASGAAVSGTGTRLTGRWLLIARVVWLLLVIPSLGLFIAGLLVSYQQMLRCALMPRRVISAGHFLSGCNTRSLPWASR